MNDELKQMIEDVEKGRMERPSLWPPTQETIDLLDLLFYAKTDWYFKNTSLDEEEEPETP